MLNFSSFRGLIKIWSGCCLFFLMAFEGMAVAVASESGKKTQIEQLEVKMNNYMGQMKGLIGDAPCDATAQCRVIAVGSAPCGGPSAYLAYSKTHIDLNKLKGLILHHSLIERQVNRLRNVIKTCEMVLQPPVACVKSRCTITR